MAMIMIFSLANLERIGSYPFAKVQHATAKRPSYDLFLGPPGKDKFLSFSYAAF